jgi:hypothetical protein
LPHFQKLFEKTKDRSDLILMTMNIDEELGLVEPFVKEKGFTFPVLPALGFINNVLDSISIPRCWILDAQGKWQWEQIGFNSSEADWEGTMLAKLESVKKGL